MSGVLVAGSTSDAGPWSYQFSSPTGLVFDQYGWMYILDYSNNRIQKWFPGAAYGSTVLAASFSNPYGMSIDRLNSLVVADTYNHRVLSFAVTCRTSLLSLSDANETFSLFIFSFSRVDDHHRPPTKSVVFNSLIVVRSLPLFLSFSQLLQRRRSVRLLFGIKH